MSEIDQFWRYAKEATLSASYPETEGERQGLLDLAQTWKIDTLSPTRRSLQKTAQLRPLNEWRL